MTRIKPERVLVQRVPSVTKRNRHESCVERTKQNVQLTSFRPVVTCTTLAEHEVVRSEEVADRTRPDRVHGSGLEVDKDGTGNVLVAGGL